MNLKSKSSDLDIIPNVARNVWMDTSTPCYSHARHCYVAIMFYVWI